MGISHAGHGPRLTIPLPCWILTLLIMMLNTGVELAEGITCYGEAQVNCFPNLTILLELKYHRSNSPDSNINICRAFDAVKDCFIPLLAKCDPKEQQVFMDDVVSYMTKPPFLCKNQTQIVFERRTGDGNAAGLSHIHGYNSLQTCGVILLVYAVISEWNSRVKR